MNSVTVILTTYNGASRGYLRQAIESVIQQTYSHYELLIIDDGSSDKTADLCREYSSYSQVRYIYQVNRGLAGARNTGIDNAKYDLICFLDDDDAYAPNKLEKQVEFITGHQDPHIGMIYSPIHLIDERGDIIGYQAHYAGGDIYKELFNGNIVDSPSSVMIHRKVFEKVGKFKEHFLSCEDYEMWFRVAKQFSIYSYYEPLVYYRIHQNNMSKNIEKMLFYKLYTFHIVLQGAPLAIQEVSNKIYGRCYQHAALESFKQRRFADFRRFYQISNAYGLYSFKLLMRNLISYIPAILKVKDLMMY